MGLFDLFRKPRPPESPWPRERLAFYERHLGDCQATFESADEPFIDILVFGPTDQRDYLTLLTSGLSDYPLLVPDSAASARKRYELLMYIAYLKIDRSSAADPWQVRLLRSVAEVPVRRDAGLRDYLAAPLTNPPRPICPGSQLTTPLFLPPSFESESFRRGPHLSGAGPVSLLWLDFITTSEFRFQLNRGPGVLADLFASHHHHRILDPHRPSYV